MMNHCRLLIGALGGEGGATITGWIVEVAEREGWTVQSTSIPGVAQRTGATTYYIEMRAPGATSAAPMALGPTPGAVDLVLTSEMIEAGRAMQNGFVSPEVTTLVSSSHRIFAVAEKAAMGDGRYDESRVEEAATKLARKLILFDMAALARENAVPVTMILLGAAATVLPMARATFDQVIGDSAKGAQASLRGFEAGWNAASRMAPAHAGGPAEADSPSVKAIDLGPFPEAARPILKEGVLRLRDYQDEGYATTYLARIARIAELDHRGGGHAQGFRLTIAAARHAALWMSYEDVIRVADLKTRHERFDAVRKESGALAHQPIRIYDFLKPGLDEICALLPTRLARPLRHFAGQRGWTDRLNVGMRIRANALPGFLTLRALASLRRLRRVTSRWGDEQARIDAWLAVVADAARVDLDLAWEVAECGRLIKGYGDTHRRGQSNFDRIIGIVVTTLDGDGDASGLGDLVRHARDAALSDPDGELLSRVLSAHEDGKPVPRPRKHILMRQASHGE